MLGMKAMLAKAIFDKVIEKISKMDDRKIASSHDKKIYKLEKEIKELKKNSHAPCDFVCLGCGCKAEKVEKKKSKRKLRRKNV